MVLEHQRHIVKIFTSPSGVGRGACAVSGADTAQIPSTTPPHEHGVKDGLLPAKLRPPNLRSALHLLSWMKLRSAPKFRAIRVSLAETVHHPREAPARQPGRTRCGSAPIRSTLRQQNPPPASTACVTHPPQLHISSEDPSMAVWAPPSTPRNHSHRSPRPFTTHRNSGHDTILPCAEANTPAYKNSKLLSLARPSSRRGNLCETQKAARITSSPRTLTTNR